MGSSASSYIISSKLFHTLCFGASSIICGIILIIYLLILLKIVFELLIHALLAWLDKSDVILSMILSVCFVSFIGANTASGQPLHDAFSTFTFFILCLPFAFIYLDAFFPGKSGNEMRTKNFRHHGSGIVFPLQINGFKRGDIVSFSDDSTMSNIAVEYNSIVDGYRSCKVTCYVYPVEKYGQAGYSQMTEFYSCLQAIIKTSKILAKTEYRPDITPCHPAAMVEMVTSGSTLNGYVYNCTGLVLIQTLAWNIKFRYTFQLSPEMENKIHHLMNQISILENRQDVIDEINIENASFKQILGYFFIKICRTFSSGY